MEKGDFSKSFTNKKNNFNGNLYQQGRVFLDSDFNDQTKATIKWQDIAAKDTIGPGVVAIPADEPQGFKVTNAQVDNRTVQVTIKEGRAWVDGLLVYSHNENLGDKDTRIATYLQPPVQDPKYDPKSIVNGVRDALIAEVCRDAVNAFQIPDELLEPALGGPDTTEKVHTTTALRLLRLGQDDNSCDKIVSKLRDYTTKKGKLTVKLQDAKITNCDCPKVEGGGFTGFEHSLYRIELADVNSGIPMFKWSQFNGGLVGRGEISSKNGGDLLIKITGNMQAIKTSGLDSFYLEVLEYSTDLGYWRITYGRKTKLSNDELQFYENVVYEEDSYLPHGEVFFRLWNSIESISEFTEEHELSDGIILKFDKPGDGVFYLSKDYWTFPVRVGEVKTDPLINNEPPQGIVYHRAPLAILHWGNGQENPSGSIVSIERGSGASSNAPCVAANNCFSPNPITVAPGTEVVWKNTDTVGHTVTSGKVSDNDGGSLFDSGLIKAGSEFKFTFDKEGTYDYFCSVHPWMTGKVIVKSEENLYNAVQIEDCRKIFRPLTNQNTCCCIFTVGDGVSSHGDYTHIQDALDNLGEQGGEICILAGKHTANVLIKNKKNIKIHGCGGASEVTPEDTSKPVFSMKYSQDVVIENLCMVSPTVNSNTLSDTVQPHSLGVVLIGDGSKRITISENKIQGGSGNGVTIGYDAAATMNESDLISDILLQNNEILDVGLAGIGSYGGNDVHQIANLGIHHNRIEGCLHYVTRDVSLKARTSGQPLAGISIGNCESVSITDNKIKNNGSDGKTQFAVYGMSISARQTTVIQNHVYNNGLLGGIGIRTLPLPDFCLEENDRLISETCTVLVHDNVVIQPVGQALVVVAIGSVSVQGNQFNSGGGGRSVFSMWGGSVFIMNVGGYSHELAPLYVPPQDVSWSYFEPKPAKPAFVSGDVTFKNNNIRLVGSGNKSKNSVTIYSPFDDISFVGNQCVCFDTTAICDVLLVGNAVMVTNNKFKEMPMEMFSLFVIGYSMNNTSYNQATNCIHVDGSLDFLNNEGNQVINHAFCKMAQSNNGQQDGGNKPA